MSLLYMDEFYQITNPDDLEVPIEEWRAEVSRYKPEELNVEDSNFFRWPGFKILNNYYFFGMILLYRADLSTNHEDLIRYQQEAIEAWRKIRTFFPRLLTDPALIGWQIPFYLTNIGKLLLSHAEMVNGIERKIVFNEIKEVLI